MTTNPVSKPPLKSTNIHWLGYFALTIAIVFSASALLLAEKQNLSTPANEMHADDVVGFSEANWYLPNEPLLGFVNIPQGEFIMGSDPAIDGAAYGNEQWSSRQRRGRLFLPQFYIGRYEVTRAQFLMFANETGLQMPPAELDKLQQSEQLTWPITDITWTDALAYCRWLDNKMRNGANTPRELNELLRKGWRIGLPSEAQWEKAARGENGRIFTWGNNPRMAAQNANVGGQSLKPVGMQTCESCLHGLSDMSGNVWEMTRSFLLPYPFDENAVPQIGEDALFVMRGGSFADYIQNARAAVRGGIDPGARSPNIGFRIVLYRP